MVLDPRSELVPRLAKEENRTPAEMLSEIARSVGVCRRLYSLLEKSPEGHHGAVCIGLYDEVPYFAYHREDKRIIIGFYFPTTYGSDSPAFELIDDDTRNLFSAHFAASLDRAARASTLLRLPRRGIPHFNDALYRELLGALSKTLTVKETEKLMGE
jgi:hypothetical protein